jgi:ABC-type nickel/cobalt efflux system permease component RcnA
MVLSATAAILHVIVPDHEIPLAMIGRANNWGIKQMSFWTLIAGIIHIFVSMIIGFIAVGVSMALAQYIANAAHWISGGLLIAFGAVYTLLAWRGKHMHTHKHSGVAHPHDDHGHGHSHDEYDDSHSHASDAGVASKGKSGIGGGGASMIAGVIGMAPCFTLIPVLVAAVPYGTNTIFWVMLAYAVATIGMMMVMANIALKAITYVMRLTTFEKHLEVTAGLVILAVGVWLLTEDYITTLLGF